MTTGSGSYQLYENASCSYFNRGACSSCSLLGLAPGSRINAKERRIREMARRISLPPEVLRPLTTLEDPWQSRRKIKMAVTGTTEHPLLGIVKSDLSSTDLTECPLTPASIQLLLHELKKLISRYTLTPYSIEERRGELKHIILMSDSALSSVILRFILRSSECVPRIRKGIELLKSSFPWIRVVSCNIQPVHAAVLEGPEEIVLTANSHMRELYGEVPLYLSPQSFMQVTPSIATLLYQRAADTAACQGYKMALDLYCGAGGFSLHLAKHVGHVTGVEVTESAIASAQRSAREIGAANTTFVASSVEQYLACIEGEKPDLIVVNPPRRGLSADVTAALLMLQPDTIFYSSCNPETFERDFHVFSDLYEITSLEPFDMFPLTDHLELFAALRLKNRR